MLGRSSVWKGSSQWEIICISNKENGKWSVGGGIKRASGMRAGGE